MKKLLFLLLLMPVLAWAQARIQKVWDRAQARERVPPGGVEHGGQPAVSAVRNPAVAAVSAASSCVFSLVTKPTVHVPAIGNSTSTARLNDVRSGAAISR